jgi:hypothetical protein
MRIKSGYLRGHLRDGEKQGGEPTSFSTTSGSIRLTAHTSSKRVLHALGVNLRINRHVFHSLSGRLDPFVLVSLTVHRRYTRAQ